MIPPRSTIGVPGFVRLFGPLARQLLRLGVPIGPAALLTVRGRRSGLPRTSPVALIESGGRCHVFAAYGEVNWVRNLRAASEGVIRIGGRPQRIRAVELSREDAAAFYRDVLVPYFNRLPLLHRLFVRWLLADVDPARAASRHPVFELHAQSGGWQ